MTHQFTLSFTWRDRAAGTQGCETFEIEAQHPRGYYGAFYGETALTISRQSQARLMVFNACSVIAFMDAAGLHPPMSSIRASSGR